MFGVLTFLCPEKRVSKRTNEPPFGQEERHQKRENVYIRKLDFIPNNVRARERERDGDALEPSDKIL